MNTGDIILFCGKKNIVSCLIRWYLGTPYTHVGIIIQDPTYIDPEYKGTYVLESGLEKGSNFGVQLTKLDYLLDTYKGNIYHRKLAARKPISEMETEFANIYKSLAGRPYDLSLTDALFLRMNPKTDKDETSIMDWFHANHRKTDTFVCSALVGYVYMYWGFLPNEIEWSEFEPASFSANNEKLALNKDCLLGPEIKLK